MILEIAILHVKPGLQEKFEADFATAGQYISSINGYIEHTLQKCLEQENKYALLVKWQKLEDHTEGFRHQKLMVSGASCCIITMTRSRWWSILRG
jgi:heme-degrading monooxygenase HmoA